MAYIAMEKLLENAETSIYKLVIMASRRAVELGSGSQKLVEADPNEKPTAVALKEIQEHRVSYTLKK